MFFLFSDETNIEDLSVYLGKTNIKEEDADKEQRFTVEKLIIHQKYNESNFNHDIGTHSCTLCARVCVCMFV